MSDLDYVLKVLNDNKDKSFVDRILNKKNSPELANNDGTISTHSMAWGEGDGRYFMYPTVLRQSDGTLKRYNDKEAWKLAHKNNGFIEFSSPEEADWFSKNYKKAWEQ